MVKKSRRRYRLRLLVVSELKKILFLMLILLLFISPVIIRPVHAEEAWRALGTGIDYSVLALEASNDAVYAAGQFTAAGGVPAHNIAKWNGVSWESLGEGVGSSNQTWVKDIALIGDELYAVGNFPGSGYSELNYFGKWDGSKWINLGAGINGPVSSIAAQGSDIYIGGLFTKIGDLVVNRVAKWDGAAWSSLGEGITGSDLSVVNTVEVHGSDVYVGGQFTKAGAVSTTDAAKWNGTSWESFGQGVGGQVLSIAFSGSDVIFGGLFPTVYAADGSSVAANYVVKWNGSEWSSLGGGVNSKVNVLKQIGDSLYAGGSFTTAGGNAANAIAKWDGAEWSAVGSGLSSEVWAIDASDSSLFAGGYFAKAGELTVNQIAEWRNATSVPTPEPSPIETPIPSETPTPTPDATPTPTPTTTPDPTATPETTSTPQSSSTPRPASTPATVPTTAPTLPPAPIWHLPYIIGYPDDTFRPESSITRAEIATILSRVYIGAEQTEDIGYIDVAPDLWSASAISKVTKFGLLNGYPDGTFRPDHAITRGEVLTIIQRLLHSTSIGSIDITLAQKTIEQVLGSEQAGSLNPNQPLTRAETVTLLNRLLGRGPLAGAPQQWTDVAESYWAYGDIQEATMKHTKLSNTSGIEQWTPER